MSSRRSIVAALALGAIMTLAAPHYPSVGQYYSHHDLQLSALGVPEFTSPPGCILGPALLSARDASQPAHTLAGVTTYQVHSPTGAYVGPWVDSGNLGFVAVAVAFSNSCVPVKVDVVGVFTDGHSVPDSITFRLRV